MERACTYLVLLCVDLEEVVAARVEVVGIHLATLERQRHGEGAHTRAHVPCNHHKLWLSAGTCENMAGDGGFLLQA